ncbi:hypothetical protein KI387_009050, partial [Taxus chinensis]
SEVVPHEFMASTMIEEGIEKESNKDGCINLNGNKIPKGLVSLEDLFDKHDMYIKSKISNEARHFVEYEN